jgi:gamma-aminobutyric acid type B receptor
MIQFLSFLQVIKDYQLFMVVGVLLVIDLAIMTTWQVTDPFYRETKQMEPYVSTTDFRNQNL